MVEMIMRLGESVAIKMRFCNTSKKKWSEDDTRPEGPRPMNSNDYELYGMLEVMRAMSIDYTIYYKDDDCSLFESITIMGYKFEC